MPFTTAPDGVRIYFESCGTGRPVILVSGAFRDLGAWKQHGLFRALAEERKVIALDLRGHGMSDKPHDPAFYGFAKNTDDVIAVLEAERAQCADVLGQSMGGNVAIALLHRPHPCLRSVACHGVLPGIDIERARQFLLRRAQLLRERRFAELLETESPAHSLDACMLAGYVERLKHTDTLAYAAEAEAQARFELQTLPGDALPTLFLACEHELRTVRACAGLPSRYSYVCYRVLPGADHFAARDPLHILAPLREFWAMLDSSRRLSVP